MFDTGIAFNEKYEPRNKLIFKKSWLPCSILAGDSIDLFDLCAMRSAPFLQIINNRGVILLSRHLQSGITVLIFPCNITAGSN